MKKLKRVLAILCILSLQSDILAHFTGDFINGSTRIASEINFQRQIGWWDVAIFFRQNNPLRLYYAWAAVNRYADNATQGSCANGAVTYRPSTRRCDDGGSDIVYTGIGAVQAAAVAASPGDTIYIRSWSGVYTGNGTFGRVNVKQGASPTNRIIYEGYQSENPRVRAFDCDGDPCNVDFSSAHLGECGVDPVDGPIACDAITYLTIKNLTVDGEGISVKLISNMGYSRFENLELKNSWQHGILGVDHSELININVHDVALDPSCNSGQCHNMYAGPDNLVDGGRYHHNRDGQGFQCYPKCGNSIIRNARFDHNGTYGLFLCSGCNAPHTPNRNLGIWVYNVIVDNNGTGGAPGIQISDSQPTNIFNAVLYNNGGGGIVKYNGGTTVIRNVIGAGSNTISSGDTSVLTTSKNVTGIDAATYWVDPVNGDFHLNDNAITRSTTLGVGVIGQGDDVSSAAGFNYDFGNGTGSASGATRTAPWDVGPYKFGAAAGNSPPTITLTSPANPFSTGNGTQTISGTAADLDGSVASVTYTCNRCGAASGAGSGTASGTPTNWNIPNAVLHAGIQTFTMTATDNLGATSSAITLTITYTPTFPGNALVGAWAFNDASGTTADDSSGLGNTGFLINGAGWTTSGHSQGALSLNGSNHYVSIASANSLNFTQGFTFSAWIMPTGVHTDFRVLFAKEGTNDHLQFLFASSNSYCASGGVLLGALTNGVSGPQIWNCYSSPIPVNIWTHVAGTYNGTTLTIYINGVVAGTPTSVTGLMEPSNLPLRIGQSQWGGDNFQGLIDDARVYNWGIPRTAASNTVPGAACVFGNPLDTAQQSIVRDMNCPVIVAVPPLPIKFPAAPSGLKLGAAAGAKFGH